MSTRRTTTLVLGASGFLGSHVVRAALERGDETIAAARRVEHAFLGRARRLVIDLLRPDALECALDDVVPTRVVNCAALSRIADCEREPDLAREMNVGAAARLARWSAAHGARYVHVSTDLVFGGVPPRASGYREDDAVDPRSVYGRTKAEGEAAVLAADPQALVVRLPLLFGDSFGRALGASDALLAAVARGERPTLFTDEWRTPLDVTHAAHALIDMSRGSCAGRLHIAGVERLSRAELGLRTLIDRGFSDPARLVRRTTRALGGGDLRPADVALDSAYWRALRT